MAQQTQRGQWGQRNRTVQRMYQHISCLQTLLLYGHGTILACSSVLYCRVALQPLTLQRNESEGNNTMNTAAERQAIADQHTFPRQDEPQYTTIRGIQSTEPSAEIAAAMVPVTVTSMGYLASLDIVPKNAVQAAKLEAIKQRGPIYQSIAFFHPSAIAA